MSVDTKDILLKAAEDVTQGMWCKGQWYQSIAPTEAIQTAFDVFDEQDLATEALTSHRCAQGSLAVATHLLGGSRGDYRKAERVMDDAVVQENSGFCLIDYNDSLPDDPFEAGQQLAELFRETAESL